MLCHDYRPYDLSMTGPRNAAVAAELRAEAARQQLTGRELARRVEKPDTTVARWLRAGTPMDLDEIEALGMALGLDTLALIARAYDAPAPKPRTAVSSGCSSQGRLIRLIRPARYQFPKVA